MVQLHTGNRVDKIRVIPYMKIDGVPTLKDSQILHLYDKMVEDQVADTIFFDGEVNSRREFLSAMTSQYNLLYAVECDGLLASACWLNNFSGKTAQMHWTMFGEFWNNGSVRIMKHTLKNIINLKHPGGEYLFDVLIGLIPVTNKRAIEFSRKCGAVVETVIPYGLFDYRSNQSVDAMLIYFTRKQQEDK